MSYILTPQFEISDSDDADSLKATFFYQNGIIYREVIASLPYWKNFVKTMLRIIKAIERGDTFQSKREE